MTAPAIYGASTAYAGYDFGTLIEEGLNERGLTADAASTEFTLATTAEQNKQKRYIKDGIAHLFFTRELWMVQREADVAAEASGGYCSPIPLPADCGRIERITVGNVPLTPLTLDEHLANLRPTSEGGGTYLADAQTDPAFYRLAVTAPADLTTTPAMHAIILPAQSASFTARFYYRSSGANLSGSTDKVYLPLVFHPLLVLYTSYRWAIDDGNIARADALWGHLNARLEEISFVPPDVNVSPVLHNTYPAETAYRS